MFLGFYFFHSQLSSYLVFFNLAQSSSYSNEWLSFFSFILVRVSVFCRVFLSLSVPVFSLFVSEPVCELRVSFFPLSLKLEFIVTKEIYNGKVFLLFLQDIL